MPEELERAVRDALLAALHHAHEAREAALPSAREATRLAGTAIRAAHRGDAEVAASRLSAAREALEAARAAVAEQPRIAHAGFVFDAEKEVAEATLTCAIIAGVGADAEPATAPSLAQLPDPEAVGVDSAAYAGGLAETVGELRRHALDRLRRGDVEGADATLALMDAIFGVLVEIDLPDGVTGGLRRATDVARSLVERTRGDVTAAVGQARLQAALERHRPTDDH